MDAVIYARISADDGRALGVTRQEQDCRRFCEQRGWNVADVLVDNDTSAFSGKRRPGYETLLEGLREHRWDALVVWHPDRLHRRPVELEEFIDIVEASGVQVSTVTAGELDLSTPDGRLMARIVGSVARKESEDKSRRLRRKQLELAEAGLFGGGGSRPFGFESDGVTVRESEAAEVRAAVASVLAGGSLRSIVTDWNARVPRVVGGRWDSRGVKRVLCSPRIAGLRQHQGQTVGPAVWPAIVDPDSVAAVRSLLGRFSREPVARSYLLTGWVVCGICGARMVAHPRTVNGRRVRRYACWKDRGGCGGCGIAAVPLEDLIGGQVVERLATQPLPAEVVPVDRSALAAVEARLVELATMWADGSIGMAEWTAARTSLEARQAALTTPVIPVVSYAGRDIAAEWETADLDGRRAMVAAALESVTIARTERGANKFEPHRVTAVWL